MNLNELDSIPAKEIIPGFHGKFVHGENMTIVYWDVEEGARLPLHSHVHEQITQVMEGKFELIVRGELHICTPGYIGVIPSNVAHEGRALTACKIMDIFSPVREEYR